MRPMIETIYVQLLLRHLGLHLGLLLCLGTGGALADLPQPSDPEWEEAIQKFEEKDKTEPVTKGGNLFIGSSSIRLWKTLGTDFPGSPAINRGFGGSQIVDSHHYADRIIIPYAPRKIFFYAGDNDVAAGKSASTVVADFQAFVRYVHRSLPETEIHFIAIKPSLRRWKIAETMIEANRLIAAHCATDARLGYIDIWTPMLDDSGQPDPTLFVSDGLHLNRTGYLLWADLVRPSL